MVSRSQNDPEAEYGLAVETSGFEIEQWGGG